MNKMKRIIVIGSSGAGKTTLAKAIAKKLDIPHFELDGIFYQKNWQPLDAIEFKNRVNKITEQQGWVICGNYFTKLGGEEFWQKADTVIWCDYSFLLVFSRLVIRTFRRTVTRQKLWNKNRESFITNFFTRDSVIFFMMRKWNEQKERYGRLFKKSKLGTTNLVRLQSTSETEIFLKRIH